MLTYGLMIIIGVLVSLAAAHQLLLWNEECQARRRDETNVLEKLRKE